MIYWKNPRSKSGTLDRYHPGSIRPRFTSVSQHDAPRSGEYSYSRSKKNWLQMSLTCFKRKRPYLTGWFSRSSSKSGSRISCSRTEAQALNKVSEGLRA